ncbi:ribonuclease H-like domain-containing protein [Tanacetum coccineum]
MEFESAHSNTTAKLPILKLENGNSWVSVLQTTQEKVLTVTKMSVPVTAKEKTNKKNDVKARSLLLMALPNEHQLTFSQYTDAKTMFAAIKTRFGGSRRFLPPEWNTHVVVWMNKAEIETMSIDDLYNNFKIVEQSVKKSVGASSGAQNLAFMTAPSTSSTNDVNTAKPAYEVSTVSPNVNTASPQVSTASFSDNVVYAFMVENPNGSNLLQQDLEQIHEDDLEAMDLKWQLSLLSMRAKRYYQRTCKKIFINANDTAGYDKSKVECFNCHKMGHFSRECRAPRNKEGIRQHALMRIQPLRCSRHINGNIAYLSDFKEFDGGYVTFRGGAHGGRISCKGTLKTDSLNFEDLPVETRILLKIPRKDNMYSFDMKNIVPKESLTCLVAKATSDESMLWHRRLGHINFKNINKLVKDNLVRGLPTKRFENDQTYVACLKVKQHKASCKFDGKSDEGFFAGYSLSSKAFRVYNIRTKRVEENLHIGFLENKPMIEGNGLKWLFDIDSLTQSINYVPVAAGTILNESTGTQGELNASTSTQKEEISQGCIVMPIWKDASYFDLPSKDVGNGEPKSVVDDQKQDEDGPHNKSDEKDKSEDDSSPKEVNATRQHVNTASHSPKDMFKLGASHTLETTHVEFFSDEDEPKVDLGNITNSYTVPTTPNTRIHKDHPIKNGDYAEATQDRKSTTRGCQFLGNRLISWQCKKQTVVATSTTEAEYGKPQQDDTGFVDSGCSRHMTRNIAYLLDFKEFDGESKTYRHVKRGRDTKIPQSSGPPVKVGDEAVHKELGDRMERAVTTASSLEAE